ncbi:hypothetical protein [Cellulomonas xiejunii]|uniref:Carrier domain-containing protein n=1 Tax=Cellulomonas xiejunii TaxID=2968083 RepID=A0ABY5KRU8_9CELL|nr:hypothetical protein [Cellulomonas xiejunii]MCC2321228.1 hypothetical protein [Cellulomonas xiejunii]UUI71815.1 hypothetical protein NP048_18845 [Cellulomonas xiejunii]
MTESSSSLPSQSIDQQPTTLEISKDEILAVLADCASAGLPETIDDDTLLVIDSYAAIWIQHLLEERHGVVVRLSGETADIDSVASLHALVSRSLRVGAE